MPGLVLSGLGDAPDRRLLAITRPVALCSLLDGIPAGLMLPVVISARQNELALVPDDLVGDGQPDSHPYPLPGFGRGRKLRARGHHRGAGVLVEGRSVGR